MFVDKYIYLCYTSIFFILLIFFFLILDLITCIYITSICFLLQYFFYLDGGGKRGLINNIFFFAPLSLQSFMFLSSIDIS